MIGMKMNQQLQIEISRLMQGVSLLVNDLLYDNMVFGEQHTEEDIKIATKNYIEEHMGDEYRQIKIEIEYYE